MLDENQLWGRMVKEALVTNGNKRGIGYKRVQISLFADAEFKGLRPKSGGAGNLSISTATFSSDFMLLTVAARSRTGFRKPDIFPEFGSETAFCAPDIRLGNGGYEGVILNVTSCVLSV